MASRRTLIQKFFTISRNPALNFTSGAGDTRTFRRVLQQRSMYQSAVRSPEFRTVAIRGRMLDKLWSVPARRSEPPEMKTTSEDARKVLRATLVERVKEKIRELPETCISYGELVEICGEGCRSKEQVREIMKMVGDSGAVVVVGNVVFLRPDQVVTLIHDLVTVSVSKSEDPRRKELEEMEKEKTIIDEKAVSLVKKELWLGLSYLILQTTAFMRLTFWELSWDVMEPICFYVTSISFMAGYTFFLRTSKEPSFETFFHSRFIAKQKRLFRVRNFDLERYNELRKIVNPQ